MGNGWGLLVWGVLGAVLGSFAGATVWRLRARQLREDVAAGIATAAEKREYRRLVQLTETTLTSDRSRCLHCGHELSVRDLIPLVSWLSTRGRCRYCHHPIGSFELLIELTTIGLFVLSALWWPFGFASAVAVGMFGIWLASLVVLVMLFFYDLKWMLLPLQLMAIYGILGLIFVSVRLSTASVGSDEILSLVGALAILGGLYWALHRVSDGAWIGNGDYKLGIGLALFLGTWESAFIALFAANLIGCMVLIPGMASGKLTRQSRVPFGPFLITGALISFFFAEPLIRFIGIY